ncbi:hypothetical protein [Rhodoferax sp.]|nr:hypothetical protein [Rhodoferax sp.]MDD4942048.1 hypothetical protein [Rhodoferax sp.]
MTLLLDWSKQQHFYYSALKKNLLALQNAASGLEKTSASWATRNNEG